MFAPILLIFDIDETLIYATETPLSRESDFRVGPYFVYRRPFLTDLLRSCQNSFQLAVWSSSGADYLTAVVSEIFPKEVKPIFVWDRERCVRRFDSAWFNTYFVKDLKKVKRLGYSLERVLIVDDTPQKVQRNYGNAIYVSPFLGDPQDTELEQLAYLQTLATVKNVRRIEKRGWKGRM